MSKDQLDDTDLLSAIEFLVLHSRNIPTREYEESLIKEFNKKFNQYIQDNYISKEEHERLVLEARIEEASHYTQDNKYCFEHIGDVYDNAKRRIDQLKELVERVVDEVIGEYRFHTDKSFGTERKIETKSNTIENALKKEQRTKAKQIIEREFK